MNLRILGAVLGVAILGVCGCRDEAMRPASRLNLPPPVEFERTEAAGVHGLRKQMNVFLFDTSHPAKYATGKDVLLAAQDDGGGTFCPKVKIFSTDDSLKVTSNGGGTWKINLYLTDSKVNIDLDMVEGKVPGTDLTGWLRPKDMLAGDGEASPDPKNYDYYVMLRDNGADPQSPTATKHYRVEAFPASSWDGKNCSTRCDCERPELYKKSNRVNGSDIKGQTHSGEGDERH